MSSILLQFPPPPRRSHVTALEQEGQMKDVPESVAFSCVPDYPDIILNTESSIRVAARCESAQLAFLSHGQTVWKRALHSWYRGGVVCSLEEITESKDEVPGWMSSVCQTALSCLQKVILLKESLFPQMGLSRDEILKKYTPVANWFKSPVQALAWHPHVTKLAVALKDDSVHVYSAGSSLNPILKHKLQKQVADLAWKPLSGSVLAVACESCVLIWHVEPTSLAVRPSSSTVQVLQSPGHSPVTSLAWDPYSSHLVSASPCHSSVLVWDVPMETAIPLKRNRGGGVAHLSYSPDGTKLLTATTSSLFRVWETHHWQWEVWSQLSGRLTASCWSPDGRVLLFAMEGESALYAIRYAEDSWLGQGNMSTAGSSVLLADVSQVCVSSDSREDVKAGGAVKSIMWDSTGERVAVMFQPDELGNNSLVAVFKAMIHPVLELIPSGFVKGKTGESAHHIAFQPSFSDGALLSVVWSSGRVGYIPIMFVPCQDLQRRQGFSFRPLNSSTLKSPYSP
ncbi:aladin [Aplysia californica]|uniref:Aladin n=1 Tax=Aplysia californica TaxID=6500 RepID=A0ABM0JAV0_APLCA|nr:aladin [Aplysia californica]